MGAENDYNGSLQQPTAAQSMTNHVSFAPPRVVSMNVFQQQDGKHLQFNKFNIQENGVIKCGSLASMTNNFYNYQQFINT